MVTHTVRSVVAIVRGRRVTLLAAGIAFYAFVSMVPLLMLTLAVGSIVGAEAIAAWIVGRAQGVLAAPGKVVMERVLTDVTGRVGAGIVGGVTLVWSGLRLFRGLSVAFAAVYDESQSVTISDQLADAVVAVGAVGLSAALVVAAGVLWRSIGTVPYAALVGDGLLLVGLVIVFLPLYYVLPPVEVSVGHALPGAAVAAVGWVSLQSMFHLYVAYAGQYAAYGILGAVLLFLMWLYFAGLFVLLGGVVNVALRGEFGGDIDAVRV